MPNLTPHAINTDMVDAINAEATRLTIVPPGPPPFTPTDDDRPKAQGFPVHVLPEGLQWIITNLNATIGFPMDYTGAAILFALSVAIGTSARITPKRGWFECAILWLALVGRPGANKTHPLSMMLRPLNLRDRESVHRHGIELREYERALKQARQEGSPEAPLEPECEQHLVSDTTPEALVEVLRINPRGVGMYRDELAAWVADFNRYSGGSEVQFFMSTWSGQASRVNRVKRKRPLYVDRPFVSVCGTIQPGVLGRLVADGRGSNGFVDRILFAYPEVQEVPAWSEAEPDGQVAEYWQAYVQRLISIPPPDEGAEPLLLTFTLDAKRLWAEHHAKLKVEIDGFNRDGDEARAGHRTKMLSYTLRLALILMLARWAEGEDHAIPLQVDTPSLAAAIALVDYFTSTADKVLFSLHDSTPVDELSGRKLKLYRALPPSFTTAKAIVIADGLGITRRTAERYLGDKKLYQRHRDGGQYTKVHEG